jgi:aminoglycoside 6-adenylyltransferase
MEIKAVTELNELRQKIIDWSANNEDIRAILGYGSTVRLNHAIDVYSDIDLLIFCRDRDIYLSNLSWVTKFGEILLMNSFITSLGPTLSVIFEKFLKFDLTLLPIKELLDLTKDYEPSSDIFFGSEVILDKDNLLKRSIYQKRSFNLMTEQYYQSFFNKYWYCALNLGKYLFRKNLYASKRWDSEVKKIIFLFMEYQAELHSVIGQSIRDKNKHLEEWANKEVIDLFPNLFASYDFESSWQALFSSNKLFSRLSRQIAEYHKWHYPFDKESKILDYINGMKNN